MKLGVLALVVMMICGCRGIQEARVPQKMERIRVAPDGKGFVMAGSHRPFHPWGMNYGNAGRLMEDFWGQDWETFAGDFRELKALGANVVRVHLQFGKFMQAPDRLDPAALRQFRRMLRLAEETGIYVDVTGLACYRPGDTPVWYDALDEPARWATQANFWSAIARAGATSPAVFCYDLINEPLSPGQRREPGKWYSGNLLGEYDFLQFITLDPAARKREEVAGQWIRHLTSAIRQHDREALITVGSLPWSRKWHFLSGFLPEAMASELDFLSVHIYPDSRLPGEAMECLGHFTVGKPVVIEETFPLSCNEVELEAFLRDSRSLAAGWIGHYDGLSLADYDTLERTGKLTLPQSIYRSWLRMFVRLKPEFTP